MASGKVTRAKWTAKLAKSIGWSRGRLAHILAHNGIDVPYKSELKHLQVLAGYGISLAKYTPTQDAVGVEVTPVPVKPLRGLEVAPVVPAKAKGMKPTKSFGGAASPPPEAENKKHGKWSDRLLVTRCAKLLPGGATSPNKNRVRYLLLKAGHTELKKVEEATALEVMKQAGYDITGFEFASAPGTSGGMLIAPPAREYESLLMQYAELGERHRKTVEEELPARDATIKKVRGGLELARQGLLSYAKLMLGTPAKPGLAATKYGGLPKPLNYPIDVLADLSESLD